MTTKPRTHPIIRERRCGAAARVVGPVDRHDLSRRRVAGIAPHPRQEYATNAYLVAAVDLILAGATGRAGARTH